MDLLAGPYYAAALLVAGAGAAKLARPDAAYRAVRAAGLPATRTLVRGLGAVEIGVAGAALAGARTGAMLLAASYLLFAGYAAFAGRRSAACGCFGEAGAPLGRLHVVVDLALAAVAAAVALAPLPGLAGLLAAQPVAGAPFALAVVVVAALLYVTLTRFAEVRVLLGR